MNSRQTLPALLVLIGCLAVVGCGEGEESNEVVQQPPMGSTPSAPAGGHEAAMTDGHGEMHSEMLEGDAHGTGDPSGMPDYDKMMTSGHGEGHGESHGGSHSDGEAPPGESIAHAQYTEGSHIESSHVEGLTSEGMPIPPSGHGSSGSPNGRPGVHGEAGLEGAIPTAGAEEFAHGEAGHGQVATANPMGIPPGEGLPGGHGEPGAPGFGGEGGEGGAGGIAGEGGAGGLGGNARPKTPAEAARMVPQVPDDTPEYPVVELIRNILASNGEEIPKFIYPLRPKGLIGELYKEESRDDAIEEGQEMLMALTPAGRRSRDRDVWITLSNPDTGKLLTFIVRKYRGQYVVYDLNTRDNPNHRPSANGGNAAGGAGGAGGEGGF